LEDDGYEVTYVPVDRHGIVDLGALESAIRPDTILVTIMLANNETGTLQPISRISELTRARGIPLHTDAVQAIGKIPVSVDELGVDLLSISGHKIYGPKGVGALYVRRGTPISPLFHGGHHERNRRPGTENVASIVGLAKAMSLAARELPETTERLGSLRDRLEAGIQARIPSTYINGHPQERLPNISNVSFEFVEGESLLLTLDMKGIAVSTGSACTSGSLEPSHVLMAMGLGPVVAQGSLRFSLGRSNTEEDIDLVVQALVEVVARFREMSPLYADAVKA
jgi:cysteine desulfurase